MSIRNTYTLSSLSVAAAPRSSRRSGSVGGLGRTSSDSSSALSALSGFLTREEFERFFELLTIEVDGKEQTVIHALYEGLYSDGWISARGVGSSAGGSGGGGTATNLLTSWGDYTTAMATTHALSAGLGYDLYTRVGALEGGGSLSAFNLVQSGSGNAVTAVTLSTDKKTLTITKGNTFLTSSEALSIYQPKGNYLTEHQSLADYLTKAEATNTYQPKGSYITAITKSMVEGVLTGNITTHTHSQYLTQHQDISHLLSKTDAASLYVKKAGDTMTGPLQLNSTLKIGATGIVVSYDALNNAICFDGNIYANGWISARGVGSSSGASGGGGTATNLLTSWGAYTTDMANTYALSAGLGYGLRSDLTALTGRVSTLEGKNYLDALTLAQSGSGNAVTALSLSSDKKTLTVTKGSTFLTDTNLNHINQLDVRNTAVATNTYSKKLTMLFMNNSTDSLNDGGTYHNVLHFGRWTDSSGGKAEQIALTDNGNMWLRVGTAGSAWEAWHKVLTDANYSGTLDSRYVTLSTAQTISGQKIFSASNKTSYGNWFVPLTIKHENHAAIEISCETLTHGMGTHSNGNWYWWRANGWPTNTSTAGAWYIMQFDGTLFDFKHQLRATKLMLYGGTSSQFLMADGSVKALSDITSAYVTALGTSGNYLTWTKNGAVNSITVPYASHSRTLNGVYTGSGGSQMPSYFVRYGLAVNMMNIPQRYCDVVYINGYNSEAGSAFDVEGINAIAFAKTTATHGDVWHTSATHGASSWGTWYRFLDSYNFNSVIGSNLTAYVKKAGDTMTGNLSVPSISGITSTALVSNLNADLLDGVHASSFGRTLNNTSTNANDVNSLNGLWGGKLFNATNVPYTYYAFLHFGYGNYYGQLNAYNNLLQFRAGSESSGAPSWRIVAFTDSNVASATKLQTARTLWGQSFDGTANVSGNMTGVGSITASGVLNIGVTTIQSNEDSISILKRGTAQGIRAGALLISNSYADYTKVPTNGIYCKGSLRIGEITLSYDSSAGALKIDGAAYTTGWFSAKGVGSSAGGTGGSVNFLTAWGSYTTSMANTYALSAGLGYDLHTRLQNIYTKTTCDGRYGSTLTISGSTLTLKSPDGTSLKSVTLPTSSGTTGSYLPLSGGTLTGDLRLKDSTNYGRSLLFGDGSYCYLKEDTDDHLTIYASKGINLSVGSGYNVTINGSAISSGGSSSGSYLPLSGGTMTGKITLMTGDNAIGNSYLFLRTTSANPYLALTTASTTFYLQAYYSDTRGLGLFLGPTSASALLINNIGNVYVASGKQLYVNGTAVTSDARLKTIIGEVSLTVEQIAHAPAVNFIWKENGLRSAGSIAQYWRTYLPDTVDVDDMGDKLYLDYSRAALLSAIVTARRVLTVESRMLTAEEKIESLTAEVTELKEKLNQYENNNITPNDNEKDN